MSAPGAPLSAYGDTCVCAAIHCPYTKARLMRWSSGEGVTTDIIAATAAERERCAKIAWNMEPDGQIAAAIRATPAPTTTRKDDAR